ncbi:MAG: hypothetical protein WEB88_03045 [Gemmatimonadota bacterium]
MRACGGVPGRLLAAALLTGMISACELRDVTTAAPVDMVIAEVVLLADQSVQRAFLHRTFGPRGQTVPGARVEVHTEDGRIMRFAATTMAGVCTVPGGPREGTCYVSVDSTAFTVEPGARYRLEIELADGGRMHATTLVPGSFDVLLPTPGPRTCSLPPETLMELRWTRSPGAWVYAVEADFGASLAQALPALNPPIPFRTVGLSVGGADTTLVFPAELGVFDRFDDDAAATLAALQGGLPRGAAAEVVVAAAEPNYVNWVRGGTFNPSGTVRVASVSGDGTGVFGALVRRSFRVVGGGEGTFRSCFR